MVIITLFSSFIHDGGSGMKYLTIYLPKVQKLEKLENGKTTKKPSETNKKIVNEV